MKPGRGKWLLHTEGASLAMMVNYTSHVFPLISRQSFPIHCFHLWLSKFLPKLTWYYGKSIPWAASDCPHWEVSISAFPLCRVRLWKWGSFPSSLWDGSEFSGSLPFQCINRAGHVNFMSLARCKLFVTLRSPGPVLDCVFEKSAW